MAEALELLLVEDNPADVKLLKSFCLSDTGVQWHVAGDGEQALDFIYRDAKNGPWVDMIILDLNLPRLGGLLLLEHMQKQPPARRVPILIFTSSSSPSDIYSAYSLGAACYIQKPSDLPSLMTVCEGIKQFWFKLAKLPPRLQGSSQTAG